MSYAVRAVLLVAILAALPSALRAQYAPPSDAGVLRWSIKGSGKEVMSNEFYTLHNRFFVTANGYSGKERGSLLYGKQEHGINLTWNPSKSLGNVQFTLFHPDRRRDRRKQVIKYGDAIGIEVAGGGWFGSPGATYRPGIIFDAWSKTPVRAYRITGGPKGTPVPVNTSITLRPINSQWTLAYVGGKGSGLGWRLPTGQVVEPGGNY